MGNYSPNTAMIEGNLWQILEGLGLSDYSSKFEEQGYDDISHLRAMTSAEVDVMMTQVQMTKPGHRDRFTKWHVAQAATLQSTTDPETGHMHSHATTVWHQPYQCNYFIDPTWRHAIAQYQHWLEHLITEFLWSYQNQGDSYYTIAHSLLQATRDQQGTRAIQNMIRSRPANHNSEFAVEVLANNVERRVANKLRWGGLQRIRPKSYRSDTPGVTRHDRDPLNDQRLYRILNDYV